MKAKRMRICGRKITTLPTPSTTPSVNRLVNGPRGSTSRSQAASQSLPLLRTSISGRAPVKMAWKTRAMTARNTTVPQTRWVRTRSRRSVPVTGRWAGRWTQPAVTSRIQA